jgi:hypothetical protein
VFAGWDWATGSHNLTVVDSIGTRTDRWALATRRPGALARLRWYGDPTSLPVAIETT